MNTSNTTNKGFTSRPIPRSVSSFQLILLAFLAAALLACTGCANRQTAKPAPPVKAQKKDDTDVVMIARKNLGIPYRYGGTTPQTGFDCSGLVCWTYEQLGVKLPRRASDQAKFGKSVDKNNLKPGDIVTFKGTSSRSGWHTGIYIGEGKFIHSPRQGKNVMESHMDEGYFSRKFYNARRVPLDGSAVDMYASFIQQEREKANAGKASVKQSDGKKKSVKKKNAKKKTTKKNTTVAQNSSKKNSQSKGKS